MTGVENFCLARFSIPGPAFTWPGVIDDQIIVGSGFSTSCQNTSLLFSFSTEDLSLRWRTEVDGAVGDTTVEIDSGVAIVGSGNGVTAVKLDTGELAWRRTVDRDACLQESMGLAVGGVLYIGSAGPRPGVTAISVSTGEVIWHAPTTANVFGRPCLHENEIFCVDMAGAVYCLDRRSGERLWATGMAGADGVACPSFAGPSLIGGRLWVPTKRPWVFILDLGGKIVRRHSARGRFIAMAHEHRGWVYTVQEDGQVYWYDSNTMDVLGSVRVRGPNVFGTPISFKDRVVMSSYGQEMDKGGSVIHFLRDGKIEKEVELPVKGHALSTLVKSDNAIFSLVTPFSGGTEAQLVRLLIN